MKTLFEEDQQYLLNVYRRLQVEIVKAKGVYLYDNKGKKYLDMFSGIAVNSLGHQHPLVKKAIKKQLNKFLHLSNYFVSDAVINLAKHLVDNSFANKVFFTNSGTEAIEAAIKLVKKYGRSISEEKFEIITLENSFHGRTIGGLSLTGQPNKKIMFEPLLPGIKHIKRNDIEVLRKTVNKNTCAIFLELVQGESGVLPLTHAYVDEVKKLAKEYNFLIVIDEIQTGLLRTGTLFTYQQYNLEPDLLTLAKSLGGGLPLGALLVSKRLENVFLYGEHGSTFGGNPLACAAGSAVFSVLASESFQKDVQEKGKLLIRELNELKEKYPAIIKDIRGLGLMVGLDCGIYTAKIQEAALNKGVMINTTNQTVIRLLPPLTIDKKSLTYFITVIDEILKELGENHA